MTNPLKDIRKLLRKTQAQIAEAIGISRGLWSVHECKPPTFDVPPHIARKLIAYAKSQGVPLRYEHLYEHTTLPTMVLVPDDQLPRGLVKPAKEKRARRASS